MDVIVARLGPLITEIRLLRSEISRLADLKELELQNVHKITTRIQTAAAGDLQETRVAYSDPDLSAVVQQMEAEAGRQLSEAEIARVQEALMTQGED